MGYIKSQMKALNMFEHGILLQTKKTTELGTKGSARKQLERRCGPANRERAQLTDYRWNELFKNACIEGRERHDVITEEDPIPEWAEKVLWEYMTKMDHSDGSKKQILTNTRSAMRAIVSRYGELDPRTITEDMIRTIPDIRPDYTPKTLYVVRVAAGRLVGLYTGTDPWENRRKYLVSKRVIPQDIEELYFEKMKRAGYSRKSASRELVLVEKGLSILSDNLDGFDKNDFGIDEIKQIGRFMLGISKKQVHDYQCALSRYVWVVTGTDPIRGIRPKSDCIPPRLWNRIIMTGFEEEFQEFINWNFERGLKWNTIESYIYKILSVWERLDSIMPEGWKLADVTDKDLVRVRMDSCRDVKESSLRESMKILGMFLGQFGNNSYRKAKMLWNVDEDQTYRTWINHEEWLRLLQSASPTERVILALGGGMGLRRAEIADLRISDIDGNLMTIRGKGHGADGKVVQKVIPKAVMEIIQDYLPFREELLRKKGDDDEDILLISDMRYGGKPLGAEGVGTVVYNLAKANNVTMSTHTLRRLYATSLRDVGTDLDTIRRMMRHSKLDTTLKNYLNADPLKMTKANDDLSSLLFG